MGKESGSSWLELLPLIFHRASAVWQYLSARDAGKCSPLGRQEKETGVWCGPGLSLSQEVISGFSGEEGHGLSRYSQSPSGHCGEDRLESKGGSWGTKEKGLLGPGRGGGGVMTRVCRDTFWMQHQQVLLTDWKWV